MKAFITITGLKFHFGSKPFAVGQKVKLVKEPDNEYDSEAIKAELPGLGCAGYVANSPHTVLGDCISAGRLYDKIGDSATAKVVYVLDNAVVCKVCRMKQTHQDKTESFACFLAVWMKNIPSTAP